MLRDLINIYVKLVVYLTKIARLLWDGREI